MKKKIMLMVLIVFVIVYVILSLSKNQEKLINIVLIDSGISEEYINKLPKNIRVKPYNKKKNENNHADLVLEKMISHVDSDKRILVHDFIITDSNKVTMSDLVEKLNKANLISPKIIHLSLGVNLNKQELENEINSILKKNIIIVAASGNKNGLSANFPARLPGVISVGSIDETDDISDFSANKKVDFYALGKYSNYEGTSFSAPIVTSHIINIIGDNKRYTNDEIIDELKKISITKNGILILN